MRKLLVAGFMCAGVVMQAQASSTDLYTPQMNAYVNFNFGAPQVRSSGLHYGVRMDYSAGFQALTGRAMPPMMQLDFTAAHGFSSALLNGQSFLKRTVQMNQDGDASAASEGGAFSSFTTLDWGVLAVGVVGVGFGVAQVAKNDESPDTTASGSSGSGGSGGSGGLLCAPGSVPGVGGQCLPLSAPSSAGLPSAPSGGGAPSGGLCAPSSVPGIGGQCAPVSAPSGGVPSAPSGSGGLCAPSSVPGIGGQCAPTSAPSGGAPSLPSGGAPSTPVSGQCLPGDPTGRLCAPYSLDNRNYAQIQTIDIERLIWLETENGHMGDLIAR